MRLQFKKQRNKCKNYINSEGGEKKWGKIIVKLLNKRIGNNNLFLHFFMSFWAKKFKIISIMKLNLT